MANPIELLQLINEYQHLLSPARLAERLTPGYRRYPHIKLIDDAISAAVLKGGARLVLSMPPRHGKSWYCSKALPAWYLALYPERNVILASYEATFAATWGRQVRNFMQEQETTLQVKLAQDSLASDRWVTEKGGGMFTTGIGGPITGRGAQLIVIDDPVKNWEEARSGIIRQSHIDWFNSTLYTRCEPGANIILLMCMTGDTPVLLPDGTEKPLQDIRPGDEIATYKDGSLTTSVVRNWKNQGPDTVYTIQTHSGVTVEANARHPFLVFKEGTLQWIRLQNLQPGDCLMRAEYQKDTGKTNLAPAPAAQNQPALKDSASPITPGIVESPGTATHPRIHNHTEPLECGTDTESNRKITTDFWRSKTENVPFAGTPLLLRTPENTGKVISASITIIQQEKFEAFSVTHATLPSDTEKPPKSSDEWLTTCRIIPDPVLSVTPSGTKDVFDIEVAETENFIANGVISHNTRWHELDLAGYLLTEHEDDWTEIRLPAVAEYSDVMGRLPGVALCPERFDEEALRKIQLSLGPNMFASLYQQRPTPLEGDIFKAGMFEAVSCSPGTWDSLDFTFITVDTAYSDKTSNDYTCASAWGVSSNQLYLMDVFRVRIRAADVEEPLMAFIARNTHPRFRGVYIEPKGHGMYLNQILPRKGVIMPSEGQIKEFYSDRRSDKVIRANNAVPYLSNRKILVNTKINDWDILQAEALGFPRAKHDDFTDTLIDAIKYANQHLNSGLSICDVL